MTHIGTTALTIDERICRFLEKADYPGAVSRDLLTAVRPLVEAAGQPWDRTWVYALEAYREGNYRVTSQMIRSISERDRKRIDAVRKRKREQRKVLAEVRALADHTVDQARAYIRTVRQETGAGPTWGELADAMGVPAAYTAKAVYVRRLHKLGAVTFTREERSLDVAPAASHRRLNHHDRKDTSS